MITIVDYGLGNVRAFANLYSRLNIPFSIATHKDDLDGAVKIILPGVGSFDYAMEMLEKSEMLAQLNNLILKDKVPVLGVCVGMQIMANSSEEGVRPGLGWISGHVKKIDVSALKGKGYVPHMGWNTIKHDFQNGLLKDIDCDSRFYFLHSYSFRCKHNENVLAISDYGEEFSCAVVSNNIYGVQFHPEKSHRWGEQLLINFSEL